MTTKHWLATKVLAAVLLVSTSTSSQADAINWESDPGSIEALLTTRGDKPTLMLLTAKNGLRQRLDKGKKKTLTAPQVISIAAHFNCVLLERSESNKEFYDRLTRAGFGKVAESFSILDPRRLPAGKASKDGSKRLRAALKTIVWKTRAVPGGQRLAAQLKQFVLRRYQFKISRFTISTRPVNTNQTDQELRLSFTNNAKVKTISVIFYAVGKKKGELATFMTEMHYKGPDPGLKHRVAVTYTSKMETQRGRMKAARVEIYLGHDKKKRLLLASADIGKAPKPNWWIRAHAGSLPTYSNNSFDSKTLKWN